MDLDTSKATLLSSVYDNKPLHCHLLLALPNCHNLKAIKESMIEIRSSFTGEKSFCTPVGIPQGKGKSAILTTETKESNNGLKCTYRKKKNHMVDNCIKKKKYGSIWYNHLKVL